MPGTDRGEVSKPPERGVGGVRREGWGAGPLGVMPRPQDPPWSDPSVRDRSGPTGWRSGWPCWSASPVTRALPWIKEREVLLSLRGVGTLR